MEFSGLLPPGVSPMRDLAQFQPVSGADNNETNQAAHDFERADGRVAMQTGSRTPDSGISPPDAIA